MGTSPRSVPSERVLAALLLSASLIGCGRSDDASSAGGAGGGSGGTAPGPSSLAFQPATALKLLPGEVGTLSVQAKPAGVYHVRFGLLGDFQDASLDKSEADTEPGGSAEVVVTAPSSPTTFSVRASVGDSVTTQAGVSVSANGFATLQVVPNYTGKRTPSYWLASVRTGTTCAELSGEPISDGDLKDSQLFGKVPQIDGVPVGPPLAVTLRGAYSLFGCLDVTDVVAGEINKVSVDVADLPMQLGDTNLSLTLGLDAPKIGIADLMNPSAPLDAIAGNGDPSILLDAMQAAATDPAAFTAARSAGAWDSALSTSLGQTALRDLVLPWLEAGVQGLPALDTFRGELKAAGKFPGHAFIELSSISGSDVSKLGLGDTFIATWDADPDDTVLLGSDLYFMPSRLIAGLALAPAVVASPGATSVPMAVSALLSCDSVATSLVSAGSSATESFPGCDQQCTKALCDSALEALWQKVSDASGASGAPLMSLVVTATGAASVDDQARPTNFSGSWVGTVSVGQVSTDVGGPATGATPPPPG